mmetsp:Transcript_125783/g.251008  ORF Transcript_125783/g.251008 Transcript_125783/m.251008 type:complete len:153 (+) Transcript_125783:52-510(+)
MVLWLRALSITVLVDMLVPVNANRAPTHIQLLSSDEVEEQDRSEAKQPGASLQLTSNLSRQHVEVRNPSYLWTSDAVHGCLAAEDEELFRCGPFEQCYPKFVKRMDHRVNIGQCGLKLPVLVLVSISIFVSFFGLVVITRLWLQLQEKIRPM